MPRPRRLLGLVSKVVQVDNLDAAVDDPVAALKKRPIPAVKAVKEYASSALTMDTKAANDFAKNLRATNNTSTKMRP